MGVLSVEEGKFRQFDCPCCGNLENLASGSVKSEQSLVADYHAAWTHGPEERVVLLAIGVGAAPAKRALVAQLRHAGTRVAMSALDAGDFGFYPDDLGEPLSREEALERPDIEHLWEIADAIIEQDTRVDGACQWMGEASWSREPGSLDVQAASFPYGEL